MKKLIYGSLVLLGAASLTSCGNDLLDETNLKASTVATSYRNQADIDQALTGAYFELYTPGSSAINNEVMMANLASDEMFGGGEPGGDLDAKAVDKFTANREDMFADVWKSSYYGIRRAALVIENVQKLSYDADALNQDLGEAYFLRAYYYLRLAKYFGGVPLAKTVEEQNTVCARSTFDQTYAFIASDLVNAIKAFPATKFAGPDANYGKVNKWVAEGYLARVYLFYTGYKSNILGEATTVLPVDGGTELTKADVIAYLDDCIANSGYALNADFRSLWPYSKAGQEGFYAWASDSKWDGDGSSFGAAPCLEKMFVVRHGNGEWASEANGNVSKQRVSNLLCVYQGVRDLDAALNNVPFGPGGWGWSTVSRKVTEEVFPNMTSDVRARGSIIDYDFSGDMNPKYVKKGDDATGLANKKYTQIAWFDPADALYKEMWEIIFKAPNGMQLNDLQDLILMRYADVLLMHSELTETNVGLNAVRKRAGQSETGYSPEALRMERRKEFAFEGLRWFDELRWGTIANDLKNVNGEVVLSKGAETEYKVSYRPETLGLWPIPESQIRVTSGVLITQNPGW